jgi:hypothetical protein
MTGEPAEFVPTRTFEASSEKQKAPVNRLIYWGLQLVGAIGLEPQMKGNNGVLRGKKA